MVQTWDDEAEQGKTKVGGEGTEGAEVEEGAGQL